jgi:hypothetical protein
LEDAAGSFGPRRFGFDSARLTVHWVADSVNERVINWRNSRRRENRDGGILDAIGERDAADRIANGLDGADLNRGAG